MVRLRIYMAEKMSSSTFSMEAFRSWLATNLWKPVPALFSMFPRELAHVPEHRYEAGEMLVIVRPAGFEGFWLEIGKPVEMGTVPSPPDGETIGRALALAPKYGLEVKLPG